MVDEQEGGLNSDDCKMETGSSFEGNDESKDVDKSFKETCVESFPILNALPPINAKTLPSPGYLSALPTLVATHPFAPLTTHGPASSQPLVIILPPDQSVILHKQVRRT